MLRALKDFDFIDIHYHANPDLFERRYSAIEIGRIYSKHKGAVVLKSHLGSTAIQASIAQSEGYPVLPSVVLNDIAGGLDHKVIIRALLEYKPVIEARMIVHLPTITGRAHKSLLERKIIKPEYAKVTQKPLTIFNEQNKLKPEINELLRVAANEPIVLSTGHASKEETYALLDEFSKYKNCKLMLNQPANPLTGLNAESLFAIVSLPNVFIEQTILTYLLGYQSEEDFKTVVTKVPQVIYSSDLGQTSQIDVEEFLTQSKKYFKLWQLPKQREELIWKNNPIKMLGF